MGSHPVGIVPGGLEHRPGEPVPRGHARVGDVERPGQPLGGQHRQDAGQIGGEGGAAPLVVDEAQRSRPLGQAQHGPHHVGAVRAAHPRRPHDRRRRGRARARRRACSARRPTSDWARPTRRTGRVRGAVEDVVGRHVDDVRPDAAGRLGDVAGPEGVDGEGPVGVAFAGVDRRPGRGVDHHVGAHALDDRRAPPPRSVTSSRAWSAATTSTADASPGGRWRRHRPGPRRARRPDRASTTSRPSWPPAPVTRTRMAGSRATLGSRLSAEAAGALGRCASVVAPRGLDHRGTVQERLPPGPVVRVPPHGVGQALLEADGGLPSRARCGSWCSRAGSGGRGRGGRGRSS